MSEPTETPAQVVSETIIVKQEWEVDLEQLRATNEELQKRKLDAERDRELFRDMYNKASAHASQISKENDELLERASLAEGQVKDGLMMIKRTYETRVVKLETEIAQLKGLNALLTTKDLKTNGDIIRRKAAEEEELRMENQALRAELAELRLDYRRMEGLLEQLGEQELEQLSEQEEDLKHTTGVDIPSTPTEELGTPLGPTVTVTSMD